MSIISFKQAVGKKQVKREENVRIGRGKLTQVAPHGILNKLHPGPKNGQNRGTTNVRREINAKKD